MKNITTFLLLAVAGCAHRPTVPQHLRAAEIAMKGVDVEHAHDVEVWNRGVDARIRLCAEKKLPTEEERARCMGPYGRGSEFEVDQDQLRTSYDVIADELEKAKAAAARLEQLYVAAEGAQQ